MKTICTLPIRSLRFRGESDRSSNSSLYIPDVNHLGLSGDLLGTSGDDSQKNNDVNHLDLSGDVLETSGHDSQENNDVNDLELSGNALELSDDHSHENNVENLKRDELTPPENSLPSSPLDNSLSASSLLDISASPATSQSVSPPSSPNNYNQSSSILDAPPPHCLPNRVNQGIPKLTYEADPKCKTGYLVNRPNQESNVLYPLGNYVSTNHLSESNKSFVFQLSTVSIPNSMQKA